MFEYTYEIENDVDYKKYNHFEISDNLKDLIYDDYYTYSTNTEKEKLAQKLYEENFINKYDRETQSEIFQLYIDNEKFKEKVLFIYSVINKNAYYEFVEKNNEISNPSDYYIKYSVIDSQNTKVLIYNITLQDISFAF